MQFKSRQNQSPLLQVNIVSIFKWLRPKIHMRKSSGMLFIFYFFIWVKVTRIYSLNDCIFSSVYIILKKNLFKEVLKYNYEIDGRNMIVIINYFT